MSFLLPAIYLIPIPIIELSIFNTIFLHFHRGGIIDHKRYEHLQDLKLSTGEVINYPPVAIYYLGKFESSGWENYLNLQLN